MSRTKEPMTGTPRAKALGSALRAARKDARLTLRALGDLVNIDHSKLSRFETGERPPRAEDVATILLAVGVSGERREEILELSRGTDEPRWLGMGLPEQQRQLQALLDIERSATQITDVSPLLVPGLLQTSDYARSIMTRGGVPAEEIETRVMVRVGRRESLRQRTDPPKLTALVGEAALRQVIGGVQVMRTQLDFLVEVSAWPNVDLYVVPLMQDWHPGLGEPFVVVEFGKNGPPVVHLETTASGLFLHEAIDVKPYQEALPGILGAALSTAGSVELITEIATAHEQNRS